MVKTEIVGNRLNEQLKVSSTVLQKLQICVIMKNIREKS